MKLENPFPGMNPWLELSWESFHHKLLGYMADAIDEFLPPDLRARPEEGVHVGPAGDEGQGRKRRVPDIGISELWKRGIPPQWRPEEAASGAMTAKPDVVLEEEEIPPRWIEITDSTGLLITAIELLSPSNKDSKRGEYKLRQHRYLESVVNLVEIDLLLSGQHTIAVSPELLTPAKNTARYLACVVRDIAPHAREVYYMPLRSRLKPLRIPLRSTDSDIILDLQPLIDRCYKTGRYWQTDYTLPLPKPLNAEDAAWAAALLQEAGLLEPAK